MALAGIPISEDQCIGDSLDTINDSFVTLDSRTLNLSSTVINLTTATTILSTASLTNYDKLKFFGNGSATFNASSLIGSQTNSYLYRVDIDGVVQEPGLNSTNGDYYLNSGYLIFSTAPAAGVKIVIIGPSFA